MTDAEQRAIEALRYGAVRGGICLKQNECQALLARLDEHRCDCPMRTINRILRERVPVKSPEIVCLCGSTRFKAEYMARMAEETLTGCIVLSVGIFGHADGVDLPDDEKEALDELHLRKIDMADRVVVICPGGYIGESTAREIAYAESLGKPIERDTRVAPVNREMPDTRFGLRR